ncbi:MAG: type II toxin-antitoxin system VapB family antitoxin [Candidatus Limnocylindrus sp.]
MVELWYISTMALNIKNPIAEQLAQTLARETGESMTQAVITALQERLDRRGTQPSVARLQAEVAELQAFLRSQPDRDTRTADEILGYDAFGLPR